MTALEGQALLDHGKAIARRYARRIGPDTAEELQAEAMARALGSPPPDGRLEPWLERIYRNLFVDLWRRGRIATDEVADLDSLPANGNPEDEALRRERRRIVRSALLALPRDGRHALLSKYFRDEDDDQVAGRLGIAPATVRTRIHRALARLRDRLGELRGCLPTLFGRLPGQIVSVGLAPMMVAALLVTSNVSAPPQEQSPMPTAQVVPAPAVAMQVVREAPQPKPVPKVVLRARPAKSSPVTPPPESEPSVSPMDLPPPSRAVAEILNPDWLVVSADPEPPALPCMVEAPSQLLAQIEKMVEDSL